jgi:hypothetical protein
MSMTIKALPDSEGVRVIGFAACRDLDMTLLATALQMISGVNKDGIDMSYRDDARINDRYRARSHRRRQLHETVLWDDMASRPSTAVPFDAHPLRLAKFTRHDIMTRGADESPANRHFT